MEIAHFTFNPFSENTYLLYDDSGECAIIDPGCYNDAEWQTLLLYIEKKELKPVLLLNTHCHLDHIFGNKRVCDHFDLKVHAHKEEVVVMQYAESTANLYGVHLEPSPPITTYLREGQKIHFGDTELDVVFTPGHSPGSISFLHRETRQSIVGDVLFLDSIGRTDLPGGDFETLMHSIQSELLTLEDDWKVFNGHGPFTTIGREKRYNPFLRD